MSPFARLQASAHCRRLTDAELALLQQKIADRAAIADIECNAVAQRDTAGHRWWDVRPMLDLRENGPEGVDMNEQALDYALERSLIERHPFDTHMVRIKRAV